MSTQSRGLNNKDFIQKRIAFFLLVIFAISITPKSFLHDTLARHNDGPVCVEKEKGRPHLHLPAFHCLQDELVVTSPYVPFAQEFTVNRPLFFDHPVTLFSTPLHSSAFLCTESRGPPAI